MRGPWGTAEGPARAGPRAPHPREGSPARCRPLGSPEQQQRRDRLGTPRMGGLGSQRQASPGGYGHGLKGGDEREETVQGRSGQRGRRALLLSPVRRPGCMRAEQAGRTKKTRAGQLAPSTAPPAHSLQPEPSPRPPCHPLSRREQKSRCWGGEEPGQGIWAQEWRQLRAGRRGPVTGAGAQRPRGHAARSRLGSQGGRGRVGRHQVGITFRSKGSDLLMTATMPPPSSPRGCPKAHGERRPCLGGGGSSLSDASAPQLSVRECARECVCVWRAWAAVSWACFSALQGREELDSDQSQCLWRGGGRGAGFGPRGSVLHIHTAGRVEGSAPLLTQLYCHKRHSTGHHNLARTPPHPRTPDDDDVGGGVGGGPMPHPLPADGAGQLRDNRPQPTGRRPPPPPTPRRTPPPPAPPDGPSHPAATRWLRDTQRPALCPTRPRPPGWRGAA